MSGVELDSDAVACAVAAATRAGATHDGGKERASVCRVTVLLRRGGAGSLLRIGGWEVAEAAESALRERECGQCCRHCA